MKLQLFSNHLGRVKVVQDIKLLDYIFGKSSILVRKSHRQINSQRVSCTLELRPGFCD